MRNGAPFLDLPESLQKLRQSLLRHEGGDKAMAQVLAVVPQTGLEAVLVAVELLLESATPSGGIGVEHVRNVIARLKPVTIPEEAVSTSILSQAPLADTARYDRLRPLQKVEEGDPSVSHRRDGQ